MKLRCTLVTFDGRKVQTLLESHPSDNVRKGLNYLTQCARVWDHKRPTKTGLTPPYRWRHTPSPQTHLFHRDMPPPTSPPSSINRRLDDMLSTPFSPRIIKYEPPRGFFVPKFSTYDGTSDPFDHIMHYQQLMTLDIGNDMLLCKVFPASLQGQALSWFDRLPTNPVNNFRELSEVFVGQYLCSARHKQNISTLQNIKMQENETLREFVKRFGQAALQGESYSMDAVLQIFKRSICPGTHFFESLAKKPPVSMDDLFRRAGKYSMLEDDIRAATSSEPTRSFKTPNHTRSSNRGQDERRPPLIRTPLTTSYEKLLPIIRDLPGFRWPRPIRLNPSERDRSKKCAYHKDHGHTTETCRCLHYMVEDLLKARHLKQYIRTTPKVAPIRAVINYIHGGALDDDYSSKRKRQRLLRAATVWEHISSIRPGLANGTMDPARVLQPHRDALILTLGVGDFDVKRILVVKQMGFIPASLENPGRILSGFNGSSTTSLGDVTLSVQVGPVIPNVLFFVVESLAPFNAILGRTWLHEMKVIPSTYHQMHPTDKDPPAADPLEAIQVLEGDEGFMYVSTLLSPAEKFELQKAHSDMSWISLSIASHQLNILSTSKPVRQKNRRFHPDRQKVIQEEIEKLLEAGFIIEVEYPEWLANTIVVPKKGGKWRVCVDYTNLDDVYPKDSFPLPRIDQIVDATSGHEMLSFLNAFFGYHQIPMAPEDEEKTTFITPRGLYCYKVMPFGLKNAGATYQRLMTKIFKPLIGDVVEVYIDDVVNLQKVFHLLRKYGMKLNPTKCVFGVSSRKFLGFMVTQRGIEINPDQVKEVTNTLPPTNKKGLQCLTGKLVALGRVVLLRSLSPREQRPMYFISKASRTPPQDTNRRAIGAIHPFRISASNNEAEYEAILLSGLNLAITLNASRVKIHNDSQFIVGQIQKDYEAKDNHMTKYLLKVQESLSRLEEWVIEKIPRRENMQADALAGIAASFPVKETTMLPVYVQAAPTIAESYICNAETKEYDWTNNIKAYLQMGALPEDSKSVHKVWMQASRFTLIGGDLYRRSFGGPYLRCLTQLEIQYVLSELHEGICGNHSRGRTLAHRAHS
ncbi:hypothetical protein AAG906_021079 [Vitis piasezkii]